MPRTLLIKNADVLVTMDAQRREILGGGLYVEDNRIVSVGTSDALHQMLSMMAGGSPKTEGTIDMHPGTHFVRHIADLTDRIAGASIYITGLDADDSRPGYARQKRWPHPSLNVSGNDVHAAFAPLPR